MTNKVTISTQISSATNDQLEDQAKKQTRSKSSIIREAIECHLDGRENSVGLKRLLDNQETRSKIFNGCWDAYEHNHASDKGKSE